MTEKESKYFVSEVVQAGLQKLEDDETKLQLLRGKLKAGANNLLVDSFDGVSFLDELKKVYF